MNTPIITLTSDFGIKDYTVAAVKGRIYNNLKDVKIVDISHEITPFSINEAAYIIKNAYHHFPKGSIHIIAVDAEWSQENKHLAFLLDDHYFMCANNGIMSLIISKIIPEKVVEINLPQANQNSFFLANFINAACHIARGGVLGVIGNLTTNIKQTKEIQPLISADKKQLSGHVIYTDNFGNIISNIDKETFSNVRKGRKFIIKAKRYEFTKILTKYNDVVNYNNGEDKRNDDGKSIALFNSDNLLEIALYRSNIKTFGSASTLLGLKYRDPITIIFQ